MKAHFIAGHWKSSERGTSQLQLAAMVALTFPAAAVAGTDGMWIVDGDGIWGASANWDAGQIPDGRDAIADFSKVDITADTNVILNQPITVGKLIFEDATNPSHNWRIVGDATNSINFDVSPLLGLMPEISVERTELRMEAPMDGWALRKTGTGVLTLCAPASHTGPTMIDGGAIVMGKSVPDVDGNFTIGAFSAATPLTVSQFSTWDLNGASPGIGSLAGNGMVLVRAGELGTGSLTVFHFGTDTTFNGVMTGSGSFTKRGTSEMRVGGNISIRDFDIRDGTVSTSQSLVFASDLSMHVQSGALLNTSATEQRLGALEGDGSIWADGVLRIGYLNTTSDWRGAITGVLGLRGDANLEKVGSGKLTFHQPQNYNLTTIANGSIELVEQGDIGRGDVSIGPFASLVVNRSDLLVVHNGISGTGTFEQAGGGTSALTAANTLDGPFLVSNGTLEVRGPVGSLGSSDTSVWSGGTLLFTRTANYAYDGVISGGGDVIQDGKGIISLTANNTINGNFTVKQSELEVTGSGTLGALGHSDVEVWGGAKLGVLPNADYTYDGVISGAGDVNVKAAGGALILTGTNTLTGQFIVDPGAQLAVGDGGFTGTLGTADAQVNGILMFDRGNLYTYAGQIGGANGLVIQKGTGKTILTADNLMTGNAEVNDGTLQLGNGGATGKLDTTTEILVNAPGTLTFNHNADYKFTPTLNGDGDVRQEGTNILTLDGNHPDFTGAITVKSGTLQVSGLLPQASVRVGTGAVLQGDGNIGWQAAKSILVCDTGGTVAPGPTGKNSVGDLNLGNVTFMNGSIMEFDLGAVGGNNDRIRTNGAGGSDVLVHPNTTLNILNTGGFDPPEDGGGIYPLIDGQNLDPVTQPDNLKIGVGEPENNAYLFTTRATDATVNLVLREHNEASWTPGANLDSDSHDFGTVGLNQGAGPDTRTVYNLSTPTDFRCLMQMAAVTDADYSGSKSYFSFNTSTLIHDVLAEEAAAAFTVRFLGSSTEGTYSLNLTIPIGRFTDEEIQQLLLPEHDLGKLYLGDNEGTTQSDDLNFTWTVTVIPEANTLVLLSLGVISVMRRRRPLG